MTKNRKEPFCLMPRRKLTLMLALVASDVSNVVIRAERVELKFPTNGCEGGSSNVNPRR